MLAIRSFLALIVIPSASEAISRTMSATARSPWPGSRERMNQAFSANRHASRNSGSPNAVAHRAHRAQVVERHRLPAARVVRDRDEHARHVVAALGEQPLERVDVHVALERVRGARVAPLGDDQVDRLGAGRLDVGARRVEMGVVRDDLARPAEHGEEDPLRRAALVRRDDVLEREQLAHRVAEDEARRRAGVGLVAALDRRPLVAAHRAVPESVSRSISTSARGAGRG